MLPNQVLLASAAAPVDAPRLAGKGSFFCLETEAEESVTQALLTGHSTETWALSQINSPPGEGAWF